MNGSVTELIFQEWEEFQSTYGTEEDKASGYNKLHTLLRYLSSSKQFFLLNVNKVLWSGFWIRIPYVLCGPGSSDFLEKSDRDPDPGPG